MDSPFPPRPNETWDSMLPGPPSRNNFGAADLSSTNLLAYAAGSSVAVADPRSMQLISVLAIPGPSPTSLAPFVTSVRWSPHPLPRDLSSAEDPSSSPLRLAAGDRQGRITILDFRSRHIVQCLDLEPSSSSSTSSSSKLGIQDLCWIRSETWLLASIHGSLLLALWNVGSGRCIWKYDASPEFLSCIRRDPFDWRHFCVIGLRRFLISAIAVGDGDGEVSVQEHRVVGAGGDVAELLKLEKEKELPASVPALGAFPVFFVRFCFSPRWRHIVIVTFPKEMVVFDLLYGTALSSIFLPRGCSKFMDVMADFDFDLLYCEHLDGKLSIWKRKEEEQVHVLCTLEELMPFIGTTVPSPSVLAVSLCQSESVIQNVGKLCTSVSNIDSSFEATSMSPFHLFSETDNVCKTYLISISDDRKIWKWVLTSIKAKGAQKTLNTSVTADVETVSEKKRTVPGDSNAGAKESELPVKNNSSQLTNSNITEPEHSIKISLIGQLHLLSSTLTILAVPSPSLTATLARGGNNPAPTVPLVALGTQSGTIEVIDVSANAVAASFSVHSGIIRGLRWLGNSRLVSFSYSQGNDKTGGYINRLILTCLRSGLNRPFRVHQKPKRAPIRALRASSSGRLICRLLALCGKISGICVHQRLLQA